MREKILDSLEFIQKKLELKHFYLPDGAANTDGLLNLQPYDRLLIVLDGIKNEPMSLNGELRTVRLERGDYYLIRKHIWEHASFRDRHEFFCIIKGRNPSCCLYLYFFSTFNFRNCILLFRMLTMYYHELSTLESRLIPNYTIQVNEIDIIKMFSINDIFSVDYSKAITPLITIRTYSDIMRKRDKFVIYRSIVKIIENDYNSKRLFSKFDTMNEILIKEYRIDKKIFENKNNNLFIYNTIRANELMNKNLSLLDSCMVYDKNQMFTNVFDEPYKLVRNRVYFNNSRFYSYFKNSVFKYLLCNLIYDTYISTNYEIVKKEEKILSETLQKVYTIPKTNIVFVEYNS